MLAKDKELRPLVFREEDIDEGRELRPLVFLEEDTGEGWEKNHWCFMK